MPKKSKKDEDRYTAADGRIQKQVTINGKRKVFYGFSDREIIQKIAEYKGEVEAGRWFADVADEWKETHYKTISYNTTRNYDAPFKRTRAHFDDVRIKDITPNLISAFYSNLARDKFAAKTVRTHKLLLNMIFNYGIVEGDIAQNPCAGVGIPKGLSKKPREIPTEDEIAIVKKSINCTYGLFHYFILYTGCRKGEALALTYGDVDREKNVIHITKSMYFEGSTPKVKTPKTEAGVRDIILLDILADKIPDGPKDKYLFFDDKPDYKTTIDRRIKRWKKETGLSVTPHQLRHAYATILYEAGVDAKAAQNQLGHTTIAMTNDIYTHIRDRKVLSTADKLNEYLKETGDT